MFKRPFSYLVIASALLFPGCFISGKVVDGNGVGVAGVTVTLSGDPSRMVTTDSKGKYRFGDLLILDIIPEGNYTVIPSKPGYSFTPDSADVTITSQTVGDLEDILGPDIGVDFIVETEPPPTWKLVPRTETSVPLGTAVLSDTTTVLATVPLESYDYVEEEYFISGNGNIYSEDGSEIVEADIPYTTRILLRRPSDPQNWSGTVQLSPLRDQLEDSTTWRNAWQYILGNGDVFVGFTMAVGNLDMFFIPFDPERYKPLDLPDDDLRLDIMAQVAWLMKSPNGLLASKGFPINDIRVCSSGWSLTGRMQVEFINKGYHARARTETGGPVIDGYLVGGIDTPLNAPLPDAAMIRINSEQEVAGTMTFGNTLMTRRPDGSVEDDRFRLYEIAGTAHGDWADQAHFTVSLYQIGYTDFVTVVCLQEVSDLPGKGPFGRAALANLDRWVREDIDPPPGSDRFIELNEDDTIVRDTHGNAVGGVRPYWMDVPTSTFTAFSNPPEGAAAYSQCPTLAHEEPFSVETLAQLYRDKQTYLAEVEASLEKLVDDRYILPEDAEENLALAERDWDKAQTQ